jgi:hypothetical protein
MKLAVEYVGRDNENYYVPKSRIIDTNNSNDVDWLIVAMTGEGYRSDSPKDCVFYDIVPMPLKSEQVVIIAQELKKRKDIATAEREKVVRQQQYEELKKEFES